MEIVLNMLDLQMIYLHHHMIYESLRTLVREKELIFITRSGAKHLIFRVIILLLYFHYKKKTLGDSIMPVKL